jgi:hypothetical protein
MVIDPEFGCILQGYLSFLSSFVESIFHDMFYSPLRILIFFLRLLKHGFILEFKVSCYL